MARPRTPIGTFGDISYVKASGGRVRARARYRDDDGKVRRVSATGVTRREAERNLKKSLAERSSYRASGELTASSSFSTLVEVWLTDLDLEGTLAPSTRALYERNMRQLVMPVFEGYSLREITVSKVDKFIKGLASNKSYSMAKQARTVLSLAFGLAVRYDAILKNPVRDTARLRKPSSQALALSAAQVDAIRVAVRSWRRGPGISGPPPDGQLEQIIEVMLGTSGRIGEVLAIRKCDVDVTSSPATVRIAGTIVSPAGKPTHRQPHPKTVKSTRIVSVPSFTAAVLRDRLVKVAADEPDHLIFVTRNGTPLTTRAGETLATVAGIARDQGGPAAFEWLARRQNRLRFLGVAFATKYLFFCAANGHGQPALVLDRLVRDWMAKTLDWPLNLEWDVQDYREYVDKMSAWAAGLDIEPGDLEMLVFQLAANGDPQSLWSAPDLFASAPSESTSQVREGITDDAAAILESLNDAAVMFAGQPGAIDPDDIADFDRGVRQLKRIVLTSR